MNVGIITGSSLIFAAGLFAGWNTLSRSNHSHPAAVLQRVADRDRPSLSAKDVRARSNRNETFLVAADGPFRSADGPPPAGFDPGGPPFGRGGFGPQEEQKLVEKFDKDGDRRLNASERQAAREFIHKEREEGRMRGRRGFGRRGSQEPTSPGPSLSPKDVPALADAPLYDPAILRTFFFEFENKDWEKELSDFYRTDVEVPAKLTLDGKTYADVGVHFRGMSSFMMVGEGSKHSLNVSLDFVHADQQIDGYRTLNLLNAHEDPTFLRAVLYSEIARQYIPAPRANFARVVINGELWGVYVNVEQFNKEFVKEWFRTTKGARWKVPGSPRGRGGLEYLGEDAANYKRIYQIKTSDDPKAWADFIKLCKVLNSVPPDELEKALAPLFDIDGALKFLALEMALINNDGYWARASDYAIYQDERGRFHILPHDFNETFSLPGGPGFGRGGPGGGAGPRVKGVELDPLFGAEDSSKPLRSKLLAAPALRTRYLGYVRDVAEQWLDWNKLGPIAERYHALIAEDVKRDSRKLESTEAFFQGLKENVPGGGFPGRETIGLKTFVEQRRAFLLNLPEVKNAGK